MNQPLTWVESRPPRLVLHPHLRAGVPIARLLPKPGGRCRLRFRIGLHHGGVPRATRQFHSTVKPSGVYQKGISEITRILLEYPCETAVSSRAIHGQAAVVSRIPRDEQKGPDGRTADRIVALQDRLNDPLSARAVR